MIVFCVQVRAPWVQNFYCLDFVTYIIPCGYDNLVTLGGTQDYGSFQTSIDDYTARSIQRRCQDILPSLSKAPIIRQWVGLRPHRGCVRVESENINGIPVRFFRLFSVVIYVSVLTTYLWDHKSKEISLEKGDYNKNSEGLISSIW